MSRRERSRSRDKNDSKGGKSIEDIAREALFKELIAEKEVEVAERTIKAAKAAGVCINFLKGTCTRGEECTFSHNNTFPKLNNIPRIGSGQGGTGYSGRREGSSRGSGECFAFQKGSCVNGDKCRYSHIIKGSDKRYTDSYNEDTTGASSGMQRNANKRAKDFSSLISGADEEVGMTWGEKASDSINDDTEEKKKLKANFGLSGALAEDKNTGNMYNGIKLKWSEPPDARLPPRGWQLRVFKDSVEVEKLHLHRQSAYLFGREAKVCDCVLMHASCSSQHAVIQFKLKEIPSLTGEPPSRIVTPYIMDLDSTNGTKLNGEKIDSARYIELRELDMLKFGESTREYILVRAKEI